MTTDTTTLTSWLLKQIAADEAVATAATPGSWMARGFSVRAVGGAGVANAHNADDDTATHIATHDPARVLATCAAHRAIVEFAGDATGLDLQVEGEFGVGRRDTADDPYLGDQILRALASIYADRDGWREEWAL